MNLGLIQETGYMNSNLRHLVNTYNKYAVKKISLLLKFLSHYP